MINLVDTFQSQMRNVDQRSQLEVLGRRILFRTRDGREFNEVVLRAKMFCASKTLLLLDTANVKVGHGLWYYDRPEALDEVDAVAVFYGYSSEPGAVADCPGNRFKDDYRRLGRCPEHVVRVGALGPVYAEIQHLLSEQNLKNLFLDLPLVRREMR